MPPTDEGGFMRKSIDQLTLDGSIPDEIYRSMRDAIKKAGEESGHLFETGQEAHYQAIAAFFALKAAGYHIHKYVPSNP
jgi:hypothetical protein